MHLVIKLLFLILAYLIGSIPTSVWIGRGFYGIDIREHGSGNAGSSNAMRILGWKAGIVVLVIDMFKGWLAVNLIHLTQFYTPETGTFITFTDARRGGHSRPYLFPVYVGFRGR